MAYYVWFRDRLHAATSGKWTPASGAEDDAEMPHNPDKPVGWPWTTFALSGDILRE